MRVDRLRIQSVAFTDTHLELALAGGKPVQGSLRRHNLADLSAAQRADATVSEDGLHVHWAVPGGRGTGITVDACMLAWDNICEKAMAQLAQADWKLDAIPPRSQQIAALWRLEADGYNGGFMQFFCNWGEGNCAIALEALQQIGASSTHAVVSRQRAVLERLDGHPDLKSYSDVPALLTEAERVLIGDELDPALWDAAEEIPLLAADFYFDEL